MGKKNIIKRRQNLPQKQTQQSLPPSSLQVQMQHSSGPLPSPDVLAHYDQIVPGAAERIIALLEKQVEHRQELERIVIKSDTSDSKLGLVLGACVSCFAIVGGVLCAIYGYTTTGIIIAGIPVPTLAAVFVYGSRQRKNEREQRFKEASKR